MRSSLLAALLAALFLLTPLPAAATPARQDFGPQPQVQPDARFYVQLTIDSSAEAAALSRLLPEWDDALAAGASQVILTQAEIDKLRTLGYDVTVVGRAPDAPAAWPACYSRLDTLYSWLTSYAAAHPNLVEVIDYGDSWCKQQGGCTTTGGQYLGGHDLLVARITNELAAGPKTGKFFTDGGLHAREIPTPELAKAFIESLVGGYGVDPNITWLLDQREIYVALTSNPDGRALVELGLGTEPPYSGNPWYWRKSGNNSIANSNTCAWPPTSSSHYGIDLNRNHIFKWNISGGGSTVVCAQDYRGPSAGSEPEILAYENFVRSIIPDQRGPGDNDPAPADTTGFLINLHNYTNGVILVPWGWTTAVTPNNAQLVAIAEKMRTYTTAPMYTWQYSLYPVSGNTRDWAYGELGIPAYVIELYGNDFFTSCSLVPNLINNMLPLLKYAATISDRPYMRVYGPDARTVAASPASLPSGGALTVTAQINDTQNGNQAIAAAELFLVRQGGPTPGDPGTGTAMAAVDGNFNAAIESVTATVSTAGLGRGRYVALVRGKDVGNNWGPFSAAPFEVTCFFADLDCSGMVDVLDIIAVAEGLQSAWRYGAYESVYDVNNAGVGDGVIDMADVQIIASYFGQPAP
ncbi:MAG TPA: M14 family zinc carboxypeptidase [Anaerolineae bacterium]|nr:M14 family zinc carboxypeptidase [Anaerolineae bacterium]